MAASSGSAGIGDQEKPTFTFEQIVLRVVVAVMLLVLFVLIVEFGQVRGRVGRLETEGGRLPRRPPRLRWAPHSRSRSCLRWRSRPTTWRSRPARR
jgi:hypothetical protein